MPVVLFPTPNASPADLRRAQAVAHELALGRRFQGKPDAAACRGGRLHPDVDIGQPRRRWGNARFTAAACGSEKEVTFSVGNLLAGRGEYPPCH